MVGVLTSLLTHYVQREKNIMGVNKFVGDTIPLLHDFDWFRMLV